MSTGWKRFWTILLGALFVLGFIIFIAGLVVRRDLLDPALYTSALEENNVYERIYVDVFGDPALQDALADSLGIERNLIAGETYAELVAVFNIILPPPRMQNVTERFFVELTDYLSGETAELEPQLPLGDTVDVDVLAEHITDAIVTVSVEAGSLALPRVAPLARPLVEAQLLAYLDDVTAGIFAPVPTELLTASSDHLTLDEQDGLVNNMLGPVADKTSTMVKRQIRASLAANDVVGALAMTMRERLRDRAQLAAANLETTLAESDALNAVAQTANALGSTGESVIAGLNTVRGYATTVGNLLLPLAIILTLLLGLIVWINSDDLKEMLRAAGWTLTAAGGFVLLLWLGVGFWLRGMIRDALNVSTALPAGLETIIDDVVRTLASDVWGAVWGTALLFLIAGLVLLAFGYTRRLLDFLGNLLAPIWAYKGWVLAGLLGLFVLVPLLITLFSPTAQAQRLACNGHIELCDRPANEIAYAATHNAMSISDYGWLWPSHDGTITDQLNAGVRALLIDTHYADTVEKVESALETMPPPAQVVAEEVIEAGEFEGKGDDSFLCHMVCGLGARILADTLNEIAAFMEANPREVLFLIIQDDITPEDTALALESVGLDQYIYDHPAGQPWPTLGEMIDSGQRLVVMAEEEGPPPSWYQHVWDITMETPYTFINYDDFSCDANRGPDDAPFFLLNHWIQRGAPNRVDAAIVNEYDFLLDRAQQCTTERGKIPNFVAINFYQNGDVMDVVNTLNGVYEPVE